MIRRFAILIVSIWAKLCYHHKVYGKEHFPHGGGIIASNHSSYLDPPLLGISCPGEVHFLARETLFHSRWFAWLLRQLNTHPVKRGQGNAAAFRKALELISNGQKVAIFPEGLRSPNGTLQKAQLGIGILVHRSNCQVIPVYLHGTFEVWSRRRKFPRLFGRRTACVFGTPLFFPVTEMQEKKEKQREIVETIMAKINDLRLWYVQGAEGTPP